MYFPLNFQLLSLSGIHLHYNLLSFMLEIHYFFTFEILILIENIFFISLQISSDTYHLICFLFYSDLNLTSWKRCFTSFIILKLNEQTQYCWICVPHGYSKINYLAEYSFTLIYPSIFTNNFLNQFHSHFNFEIYYFSINLLQSY